MYKKCRRIAENAEKCRKNAEKMPKKCRKNIFLTCVCVGSPEKTFFFLNLKF